jgi:CDP-glucose 4,6-dehydratase
VNGDAWAGRSVLVTGHTGFKGAWLTLWLEANGAQVSGLALDPPTTPSLNELARIPSDGRDRLDVLDRTAVVARLQAVEPSVVFHLAARSLVRPAFADPVGTFSTNVLGTAHVLDAVRVCPSVRAVVVVTSDKVYEPHPGGRPHIESSPFGSLEPYGASKAASELVTAAYRHSYLTEAGIGLATARAGNVIGGGDWGEDRIVPDTVRALEAEEPVRLRRPDAVRPWQHVLDPLHGYTLLAERLLEAPGEAPTALNFGPDPQETCSVAELVDRLTAGFGGRPGWQPAPAAEDVPETAELRLDASRAHETLQWSPRLTLDEGLQLTVEWYREYLRGADMRTQTLDQIAAYRERL